MEYMGRVGEFGYSWEPSDVHTALIAMVPGIENTSYGQALLASLRQDPKSLIQRWQSIFQNDLRAAILKVEETIDDENEVRRRNALAGAKNDDSGKTTDGSNVIRLPGGRIAENSDRPIQLDRGARHGEASFGDDYEG